MRVLPLLATLGCPQLLEDDFRYAIGSNGGEGSGGDRLTAGGGRDGGSGGHPGDSAGKDSGTGGSGSAGGVGGTDGLGDAGGMGGGAAGMSNVGGSGGTTTPNAGAGGSGTANDGTCDDSIQNNGEDAVDCGGACAACIHPSLKHRFPFDGSGTTLVDVVGSANGAIIGTSLTGAGYLTLEGDDALVSLDNSVLEGLTSVTVEAWVTWNGGDLWQRIFDFGSSTAGEMLRSQGESYLALAATGQTGRITLVYSVNGLVEEVRVVGSAALPTGRLVHVAAVADEDAGALSLYVDGALDASSAVDLDVPSIVRENIWLGLSQYDTDPSYDGTLNEVRVYATALDAATISRSYRAGPNAPHRMALER